MSTAEISAAIHAANEAGARMIAARAHLVQYEPFTGHLSLGLKLKADASCKTAWTDGQSIGFNPKFIQTLITEHVIGLFYHELLHVALGHPWRRGNRDPKRWNIACDKVVNWHLLQAGFKLPPNAYVAEGEEIGKSAEWIYAHTPAEQEQEQPQDQPQDGEGDEQEDGDESESGEGEDGDESDEDGEGDGEGEGEGDSEGEGDGKGDGDGKNGSGKGDGDGEGNGQGDGAGDGSDLGEVRDAPEGVDEDGDQAPTEGEMQQRVARAATYARMQGNYPANIAEAVGEALKPRIDVRALLLQFMQENCRSDYDWMRPSKRYLANRVYLPSRHSKRLKEVAVYVDTSASMDTVALANAQGIVESVIDEVQPDVTSVWYADTRVARADRFERGDTLVWSPAGRGGTNFAPALAAIDEEATAKCIVCITDMDGSFPAVPPQIPVIWLNVGRLDYYKRLVAPFGETIVVPAE